MILIYLAGPYRGRTEYETQQNVQRAVAHAEQLVRAGVGVIVPHLMSAGMERLQGDAYWLQLTLDLMLACDAVYDYSPNRPSRGRDAEIEIAQDRGYPVFRDLDELIAWAVDR